ncbi:MAG: DUF1697 domain-containing protein [Gammaproteobacteria bacterium]
MNTYIVLFRGINVCGRNILPMKELASLLVDMGFIDVKTYIQSGNVLMKGKSASEDLVKNAVKTRFGFQPEVMLLTRKDFEAAVRNNPFDVENGKEVHLYFTSTPPVLNLD